MFLMGLIVYDTEFFLETNLSNVDVSGVMMLNEGAVIR